MRKVFRGSQFPWVQSLGCAEIPRQFFLLVAQEGIEEAQLFCEPRLLFAGKKAQAQDF